MRNHNSHKSQKDLTMAISEKFKHELIGYGIVFGLAITVVAIFSFFLSGLSSESEQHAKKVLTLLAKEKAAFHNAQILYQKEKKMEYFQLISEHETNEEWQSYFDETQQVFARLELIKMDLEARLKKDDSNDQEVVNENTFIMNRQLENIQASYRYPLQRLSRAKELQQKEDSTIHQIFLDYDYAKTSSDILYSLKDNKNSTKLGVAEYLLTEIEGAKQKAKMLENQTKIDLLDLYDAQQTAHWTKQKFTYLLTKNSPEASELSSSRSIILVDMKSRYFFTPIRCSWNESSDYSDNTYCYSPIEVGYEKYKTLLAQEDSELKPSNNSFFDINGQKVFNPYEQWPSDSTTAEYWIDDISSKYYHRYAIFTDEQVVLSDWIEVDESKFYQHLPHYGMEISSKPYGYLVSETLKGASPAAISFVNNPLYGSWKGSEWYFHPNYDAIFTPYMLSKHYTKEEYEQWRKSSKRHHDFYGISKEYGTNSAKVYKSPTYINSDFVRLYIDLLYLNQNKIRYKGMLYDDEQSGGGGYSGSSYSAKNAGRSIKGGGPGGYGK